MTVALCTAATGGGLVPCKEPAARRFVTCLYPDGPELRLCERHDAEWYRVCIDAIRTGSDRELTAFGRFADDWRYAA